MKIPLNKEEATMVPLKEIFFVCGIAMLSTSLCPVFLTFAG